MSIFGSLLDAQETEKSNCSIIMSQNNDISPKSYFDNHNFSLFNYTQSTLFTIPAIFCACIQTGGEKAMSHSFLGGKQV